MQSKTVIDHLALCTAIHSDGTFYTSPRHFLQVYTIQGWSPDTGFIYWIAYFHNSITQAYDRNEICMLCRNGETFSSRVRQTV